MTQREGEPIRVTSQPETAISDETLPSVSGLSGRQKKIWDVVSASDEAITKDTIRATLKVAGTSISIQTISTLLSEINQISKNEGYILANTRGHGKGQKAAYVLQTIEKPISEAPKTTRKTPIVDAIKIHKTPYTTYEEKYALDPEQQQRDDEKSQGIFRAPEKATVIDIFTAQVGDKRYT
ncbi:MAG: hypothetical protein KBD46_02525, partial [Candidatus Levybacteria bacterium]|nr:hypothetical protein [Candidatus Levybacteria bacterium]